MMAGPLSLGSAVVLEAISIVNRWADRVTTLVADATSLIHMVGSLTGGNYGRYFSGARNFDSLAPATTTIADLIGAGCAARAEVAGSVANLRTTAANIGAVGPAALATAIQETVAALASALNDPRDAIRILTDLATFSTDDPTTADAVGVAIADMQAALINLLHRAAVSGLARTSAAYQPSSYDDAIALMNNVVSFIEDEIAVAGDSGDDATYRALRTLRVAVIADLTSRGANLAQLATVASGGALPSLVIAYRLYQDASRDAELIGFANPAHPGFMPLSFEAPAS